MSEVKQEKQAQSGLTYSKIAYAVLYTERRATNPELTIGQFNADLLASVTRPEKKEGK